MVRDLVERTSKMDSEVTDLRDAVLDVAGEAHTINRKRLGRWIARHAGQLVDGLKIVKSPVKKNSDTWGVRSA